MGKNSQGDRSVRLLRVGENVRHAMADILCRDVVQDSDLRGVSITVTEAQVSSDLRYATIFVMPLAGKNQELVINALNRASGFLRGLLSQSVKLKYTPKLTFEKDRSFDEAQKIENLLNDSKVKRDISVD
ncbi:MAG: 30S ribosome-binding factor RbfA [Sphingomonadales bacterium]|jgi:ribosome-binding factor A